MEFDMPKDQCSYIKVFGLGGGGGNAVNYMHRLGIEGVNFYVCNTDEQAMNKMQVANKIVLGPSLLQGLGAGAKPEVGKEAAQESIEEINTTLERNTKMLFIVAGLGKGTGTGSAPVIARAAKEKGILTVAVVTMPFKFEGNVKTNYALDGLKELKENVDSLIIIENDKLMEIYSNFTFANAFSKADDVVANAVKSIAEIVTIPGYMNVDFNDVKTVMKDSGVAIMGLGKATGKDRAIHAANQALNSPLLRNQDIYGAQKILLNISTSSDENQLTMEEVSLITNYINDKIGKDTFIIWGNTFNDDLQDELHITLVATGFKTADDADYTYSKNVYIQKTEDTSDNFLDLQETSEEKLIDHTLFENDYDHKQEEMHYTESVQADHEVTFELALPKQNVVIAEASSIENAEQIVDENGFAIIKVNKNDEAKTKEEEARLMDDERRRRMKLLSNKYNNPKLINDLEKQPAVVRNNTELNDFVHSSSNEYSDFYIGDDDDKQGVLKKDNGYIHPNID